MFAYAAAQVKNAIDATHKLGGANYVLWGGREGYETLLNTDFSRELEQLGRFLSLVVDYKHKIGFKGVLLVEPKPQEPTKHQYDFDVATVAGFLRRFGLEREVKLNIEVGHAVLAHHSFEHEVALASALGLLGSVDANRNDYQSGWDTDQFPNNAAELVPALYFILKQGGIAPGGFNFDSKVRRQSIDPGDLLHGHIGGIDACAEALVARGGAHRRRQVRRAAGRALRRLERRRGAGDAHERRKPRGDRQAGRRREDRPEAAFRPAGVLREPGEPLPLTRPAGRLALIRHKARAPPSPALLGKAAPVRRPGYDETVIDCCRQPAVDDFTTYSARAGRPGGGARSDGAAEPSIVCPNKQCSFAERAIKAAAVRPA